MYRGLEPQKNPVEYDRALSDFLSSDEEQTQKLIVIGPAVPEPVVQVPEPEVQVPEPEVPSSSRGQSSSTVKKWMTPHLSPPASETADDEVKISDANRERPELPYGFPLLPRFEDHFTVRVVDAATVARHRASEAAAAAAATAASQLASGSSPLHKSGAILQGGEPRMEMVWNVEQLKRNAAARAGVEYVPFVHRPLSDIPAFQPGNELPSIREQRHQDLKDEEREKLRRKWARRGKVKKLTKKKSCKEGATAVSESSSDEQDHEQARGKMTSKR